MRFIKYLLLENKAKVVFLTIAIILLYFSLTLPNYKAYNRTFLSKFDAPQNRTVIMYVDGGGNFETKCFENGEFKLINSNTLQYDRSDGFVFVSQIFSVLIFLVLIGVTIWGDEDHNWNITKCRINSALHKISVDVEHVQNDTFYYYYIKNKLIIKSQRRLSSKSDDLFNAVKAYLEFPKLCLDYEGTTSKKRDNKLSKILN